MKNLINELRFSVRPDKSSLVRGREDKVRKSRVRVWVKEMSSVVRFGVSERIRPMPTSDICVERSFRDSSLAKGMNEAVWLA